MAEAATVRGTFDRGPEVGEPLSWRENRVLALIAEGATDREIAAMLFLAESTVSADVRRLRAKLGARNRAHAVTLSFRSSLAPAAPPAPRAVVARPTQEVGDVVELLPDLVAQMFGGMVTSPRRAPPHTVAPRRKAKALRRM